MELTQEYLKSILNYNPETGVFVWLSNRKGRVAGCRGKRRGEIKIRVDDVLYLAHRLAFLYMNGKMPLLAIDHLNHNPSDNRWCNLREVSHLENGRNMSKSKKNSSGVTGVSWYKRDEVWRVYITPNGRQVHLGYTDCFSHAVRLRKTAEIKYGFHKNHGS